MKSTVEILGVVLWIRRPYNKERSNCRSSGMAQDKYTKQSLYEMGVNKNEEELIDPEIEERIYKWVQENPTRHNLSQFKDKILQELKEKKDKALNILPEYELFKKAEKNYRIAVASSMEFQKYQYYQYKWGAMGSTVSSWYLSPTIYQDLQYGGQKVIVDSLIETRDPYIRLIAKLQGTAIEAKLNGTRAHLDEIKYILQEIRGVLRAC